MRKSNVEEKEVRSVQYEVTQEMADMLRNVSDLGAEISCFIIPSLQFLADHILDQFRPDDGLSGWYASLIAVKEKLEKISGDIEIMPRSLGWDIGEAIEAVHGEDKKEDRPWNKDTIELIDRLGTFSMQMKELSQTVSWRIDKERKAEAAAQA